MEESATVGLDRRRGLTKPAMAVMLANHPKTLFEPLEIPMYANPQKRAEQANEIYGNPLLVVLAKMRGALPDRARP